MADTDPSKWALDSADGIAHIMKWARASKIVLSGYHRNIAEKHGVSTDGVIFAGMLR